MNDIHRKKFLAPFAVWHGWACPLFSFAFAATVVIYVWKKIRLHSQYQEFVVGVISWGDASKAADFVAFYLFVGLALVIFAALQAFVYKLSDPEGRLAESVRQLIWLSFLPLAFWLGAVIADPRSAGLPLEWAVAATILMLFLAQTSRREERVDPERLIRGGAALFSIALISLFDGLACVQIISLFGVPWPQKVFDFIVAGTIVLGLAPAVILLCTKKDKDYWCSYLCRYLLVLQIPLPLLFLSLLPPRLLYGGELQASQVSIPLALLIGSIVVCSWISLALLYSKTKRPRVPSECLSPMCLVGIAIFVAVRGLSFPTFFADDFHLGEQLLPWQQLIQFEKIPYVDFAPVHGLMPLMVGFLNSFFYDGTMANLINSANLLQALGIVASFSAIYYLAGAPIALFCSFLLPSHFFWSAFDRLLFLAPALFVLSHPRLYECRKRWLIAWLLLSSFMMLYNPSVGAAFGIGTVLFAFWQGMRLLQEDRRQFIRLAVWAGIAAVVIFLHPLSRGVLLGYLAFVGENGATNTIAHGIPWAMSLGKSHFSTGLLSNSPVYESLRLLWIPFVLYAVFAALRLLAESDRKNRKPQLFLLLGPALVLTVLSVWSLGRIDPGAPSRTGGVSFLVFGQFLPVSLCLAYQLTSPKPFVFLGFVGGIFSALFGFQDHFSARQLSRQAVRIVKVPESLQQVDGAEIGMPGLGLIFADPTRLGEVRGFRDALSRIISDDQTYFDLTNKQAHYFYANRAVPALYSATFNAVNQRQQRRILNQIQAVPPAAVVIRPSGNFDGFSSSLRSFHLYRHVVLNYDPIQVDGYTFMVNESSKAFQWSEKGPEKLRTLSSVFAHYDLKAIPTNWGHSWGRIQREAVKVAEVKSDLLSNLLGLEYLGESKFKVPQATFDEGFYLRENRDVEAAINSGNLISGFQHYQLNGMNEGRLPAADFSPPLIEYGLESLNLSGRDADLVVLEISSPDHHFKTIDLKWAADGAWIKESVRMEIRGSFLVIPVSSFPEWLLAQHLEKLQIVLPTASCDKQFEIRSLSLWRIKG